MFSLGREMKFVVTWQINLMNSSYTVSPFWSKPLTSAKKKKKYYGDTLSPSMSHAEGKSSGITSLFGKPKHHSGFYSYHNCLHLWNLWNGPFGQILSTILSISQERVPENNLMTTVLALSVSVWSPSSDGASLPAHVLDSQESILSIMLPQCQEYPHEKKSRKN